MSAESMPGAKRARKTRSAGTGAARTAGFQRPGSVMVLTIATLLLVVGFSGATFSVAARPSSGAAGMEISPERMRELTQLAHEYNRNMATKAARKRVHRYVGAACLVLLVGGIGLKLFASDNDLAAKVGRLALFAAALCAFTYIVSDIYFDLLFGRTSSSSRSGAHVVAAEGSLMFWIIVAGKLAGATVILSIGLALLRERNSSSS